MKKKPCKHVPEQKLYEEWARYMIQSGIYDKNPNDDFSLVDEWHKTEQVRGLGRDKMIPCHYTDTCDAIQEVKTNIPGLYLVKMRSI